jgi:cellulose biosynthesis protein BcsQ
LPKEPGFYRPIVDEELPDKVTVPVRENLGSIPRDKRAESVKRTIVLLNVPTETITRALNTREHDLVILDPAPSLNVLYVLALTACSWVLIPTELDAMAIGGVTRFCARWEE